MSCPPLDRQQCDCGVIPHALGTGPRIWLGDNRDGSCPRRLKIMASLTRFIQLASEPESTSRIVVCGEPCDECIEEI